MINIPAPLKWPYRYSKRLTNSLLRRDVVQRVQFRCSRLRLGNERAQWCVCPDLLSPGSIVYSFGVGSDVSFDLELLERFGLQIHAFDPTPRALRWVGAQKLPEKFVFHPYGVANFDGVMAFNPPLTDGDVSYSSIRSSHRPAVGAPVHRLLTIMRELGHSKIDLLKLDIEGSEYDVLDDLISSKIQVRQLLVEFHHHWREIGIEKTKHAIRELNRSDYRIFDISSTGEEYAFLWS